MATTVSSVVDSAPTERVGRSLVARKKFTLTGTYSGPFTVTLAQLGVTRLDGLAFPMEASDGTSSVTPVLNTALPVAGAASTVSIAMKGGAAAAAVKGDTTAALTNYLMYTVAAGS